jgi:hypothetical protein
VIFAPRRLLPVVPTAIALVVVLPAAAVMPDPLWIAGVYDGGDSDDLMAVSAEFSTPGTALPPVDRSAEFGMTHRHDHTGGSDQLTRPGGPRAPPRLTTVS